MIGSRLLAGGSLLLCLTGGAAAAPVYSWIDAEGVTHFSETPPQQAGIESTVRDIVPAPGTASPPPDDYYSIANQAARMEARRLEQERLRAEILRAEAEARRADAAAEAARAQAVEPPAGETTRYVPLYPWYPYGYRHYPYHGDPPRLPPRKPRPRPERNKKLEW